MPRCVASGLLASLGRVLAWPGAFCGWALGLWLALASTAWAQSQPRPFTAQTLRGQLVVTQPPEVSLNGKPARLSPGARIFGADNLMQMSSALVGQRLLVHYTLEPLGLVHRVWVLTADEAAVRPWPSTPEQLNTWAFDPASQTWARP